MTPDRRTIVGRTALFWGGGAALVACVSLIVARLATGGFPWLPLAVGWLVALANAAAASILNRAAVGGRTVRHRLWGLGSNVARSLVLLIAIVLALKLFGKNSFLPFLIALFSGYCVSLAGEVTRLHRAGVKGSEQRE